MSTAHFPGPGPSSQAWSRLETVIERFEAAWERGQTPDVGDFLRAHDAERRALLGELAHVDLEWRWRSGRAVPVEDYFRRYPELEIDPTVALGLIVAEYELRRQREPDVSA